VCYEYGKATLGKERTVAACKESLPTSCGPHRNRFLEVQAETKKRRLDEKEDPSLAMRWPRIASDKKTLLAEANASTKRNLIIRNGLPRIFLRLRRARI
jgi:hypothetical protein